MKPLDHRVASRLCKLLELLSSQHDGERAAAGRLADQLLHKVGWSWPQLLRCAVASCGQLADVDDIDEPPSDVQGQARWLLDRFEVLSDRNADFLENMCVWTGPVSDPQRAWLRNLVQRARTGRPA